MWNDLAFGTHVFLLEPKVSKYRGRPTRAIKYDRSTQRDASAFEHELGSGPARPHGRGEGGGGDESEYESKDELEGKDGRCCCMWNQWSHSSLRVPPTG